MIRWGWKLIWTERETAEPPKKTSAEHLVEKQSITKQDAKYAVSPELPTMQCISGSRPHEQRCPLVCIIQSSQTVPSDRSTRRSPPQTLQRFLESLLAKLKFRPRP